MGQEPVEDAESSSTASTISWTQSRLPNANIFGMKINAGRVGAALLVTAGFAGLFAPSAVAQPAAPEFTTTVTVHNKLAEQSLYVMHADADVGNHDHGVGWTSGDPTRVMISPNQQYSFTAVSDGAQGWIQSALKFGVPMDFPQNFDVVADHRVDGQGTASCWPNFTDPGYRCDAAVSSASGSGLTVEMNIYHT